MNESRQLKWSDLTKKFTSDGVAYLEWNERLTKTRVGDPKDIRKFAPKMFTNLENSDRCPVQIFDFYSTKRPLSAKHDALFLGVNHSKNRRPDTPWFMDYPMGINRLGEIMGRLAKRAGLDKTGKHFTNHSVRRSMCTQLFQMGVPPLMIAQLSGHKNVSSLTHYTEMSEEQQCQISQMLLNPGSVPAAAGSPACLGSTHMPAYMAAAPINTPARLPAAPRAAQEAALVPVPSTSTGNGQPRGQPAIASANPDPGDRPDGASLQCHNPPLYHIQYPCTPLTVHRPGNYE